MPDRAALGVARSERLRTLWGAASIGLAVLAVAALFLVVTTSNPPGFYRDEAAIAYNALSVAHTGKDEFGATRPLFFRSFGDYKSPAYIYLLAGVFKISSPSILAARFLSAALGLAAVVLLGLLAARASGRAPVGVAVMVFGALNPWLFEVSRVVFEVALFPLVLVLFLLLLHRAQEGPRWSRVESAGLGALLGLITYTYPTGRLLAPLLALGLLLFVSRRRWVAVLEVWLAYGLALVPLIVYAVRHPGALGARFEVTSYITHGYSARGAVRQFVENHAADANLWRWVVDGDPNPRHHVPGMGSLLVATAILGVAGIALVVLRRRSDPWWRFALFGLVASLVPAALTFDRLHTLRLIPAPIFFLLLTVPALEWLWDGRGARSPARAVLALVLAGTVAQGAAFQWQFREKGPDRGVAFEAAYPRVFAGAVADRRRPIHVFPADHDYVLAYWYGALWGVGASEIVEVPAGSAPPSGALVVTKLAPCPGCLVLAREDRFVAYVSR